MRKLLKSNSGEGYIDVVVIVMAAMLVIAFAVKLFPVFIAKNQVDTYASEIMRVAEISGCIGDEVNKKTEELNKQMGLSPSISWDANCIDGTNEVQLNDEMIVTVTITTNIGFFIFGSFPVELTATSKGSSEVYWK